MSSRSDYLGPLDFGEDLPVEDDVVVSLETRALERAHELARAQSTDEEIGAALTCDERLPIEQADALVSEQAEALQRSRFAGRAALREHACKMAMGLVGGTMSSAQQAALTLIGTQHLGWSRDGVDAKVRRAVEKAEREAAKRKGAG